jgi:hypothetical protein
MTVQEIEKQLLALPPSEKVKIIQMLVQSLVVTPASPPIELAASGKYPLRGIPIEIPPDFDEPMPELWGELGQ